jgi:hypothetical protein
MIRSRLEANAKSVNVQMTPVHRMASPQSKASRPIAAPEVGPQNRGVGNEEVNSEL